MFAEVSLDRQNDIGLTAVNAFIAQLLLDATLPSSIARLNTLAKLLFEFPWDPERRFARFRSEFLRLYVGFLSG